MDERRAEPRDGRAVEYVKTTVRLVFWTAETVTIRLILANSSLVCAIALLLDATLFQRHGFEVMRTIANQPIWAMLYFLHFLGVYWRLFEAKARPRWALVIHAFGLVVWLTSTLAINVAAGHFVLPSASAWMLCFASAWDLYRTGFKQEIVTP